MCRGAGGLCSKTGPTCVDSLQFCNYVFASKKFQYCASCRSYVNCTGFGSSSMIVDCPEGTFFDQTANECVETSTTCAECYAPCEDPQGTSKTITTATITTQATTTNSKTKNINV